MMEGGGLIAILRAIEGEWIPAFFRDYEAIAFLSLRAGDKEGAKISIRKTKVS
ncbi:MAG: hypothetical protein LBF86_07540 [Helicobacteraceae bacterium]|jgi:hypothetical protein|nr:hypothetical protein [Helicobacteraceae bacterium]